MRNSKIDMLRFIGLAMIILAHVGSYGILFQLRNFDVPLMVLVSGMSFGLSYKVSESYFSYLWKRVKRLIFPVWIFLTIYFLALLVFNPSSPELNAETIITSFSLMSGIGYVWIIRVFILVALISPFIFNFHTRNKSHTKYFLALTIIFLVYELFRYLSLPYIQGGLGESISSISHYVIPYGVIFALGLRIATLKDIQVGYLSALSLLVFGTLGTGLYFTSGSVVSTQTYKYPPSMYYFSYAIFVSGLLWVYAAKIERLCEKIKVNNIIAFCAQNSIWIYLWHILIVKNFHANYVLKYLVVFGSAITIVFVQRWLVNKIIIRTSNDYLKKNIKILFTG